jgi:hypothetical protein
MTRRRAREPMVEPLDRRLVLSPGTIPAALGSVVAGVPTPGSVAYARAEIQARNLANHRHATILGVTARPTSSSGLRPALLRSLTTSGRHLPFHVGAPYNARLHPFAMAYTKTANPGAIATALTGSRNTTGSAVVTTQLLGDVNGDAQVNLTDLQDFAAAYPSKKGDPNYNPAADFNHNGQVGQDDGRMVLRNMTTLAPKQPLKLEVHALVPQQALSGHQPVSAKGGVVKTEDITIVGHTVPGALVITDSGLGNYSFTGPAYVTDAHGNFSYHFHIDEPFANTDYLILDAYGQQLIKDLPIRLATKNTS